MPSIGQIVLFHFDNGHGLVSRPAIVTHVHDDGTANLAIIIDRAEDTDAPQAVRAGFFEKVIEHDEPHAGTWTA